MSQSRRLLERANHAWGRTVAVLVAIQPEHAAGAAHRRNNRLEGRFSERRSGRRGGRSRAKSTQKTPACDRHGYWTINVIGTERTCPLLVPLTVNA